MVRALMRDWQRLNYLHFRDALVAPVLLLSDAESRLGQWSPSHRTIEIARRLVASQPWGVVVEVLKHEMAHQYAHEVLRIAPASAGIPGPAHADGFESPLARRIARLLALAESDNANEAELAMREAQRLMLKYNIDVSAEATRRNYEFRHLGEPTGRMQSHQHHLSAILGRFFFVEAIWVSVHRPLLGRPGTVLEVCGTRENVEMASYVHDFLLRSAEHAWRQHQRAARISSDRDRRSYLTGVMRGFYEKLEAQQKTNRQEGLVWVKDNGLTGYFHARYPKQRTIRSTARARPDAYAHGKQAGSKLVIHKPVGGGSSTGGRALPPRR